MLVSYFRLWMCVCFVCVSQREPTLLFLSHWQQRHRQLCGDGFKFQHISSLAERWPQQKRFQNLELVIYSSAQHFFFFSLLHIQPKHMRTITNTLPQTLIMVLVSVREKPRSDKNFSTFCEIEYGILNYRSWTCTPHLSTHYCTQNNTLFFCVPILPPLKTRRVWQYNWLRRRQRWNVDAVEYSVENWLRCT